ncbi:MAG: insulinase family protein [Alphaproteobacteria bacterium]|nr:insulinase family protein [Alphaproteobacteria bacterium]
MMWLILPAFAEDVPMAPPSGTPMGDEAAFEGPDRSHPPDVLAPVPLELDDLERHELGTGIDALYVRVPRLRKTTIELTWWQGRVDLADHAVAAHSVLGSTWDLATEAYDGAKLSELQDVLDLDLWAYLGDHRTGVGITVPLDDLDAGLDVLEEVVKHPTFPNREIKLNKEETRRFFEILGPASPARVAGSAQAYSWNAADHPYGYRPDPAAHAKVKRKDVVAVHQQILASGPASLIVVGDLAWEEIEPKLKARFGSLGKAGERSEVLDAPTPTADRVIAVAMPDAEQLTLRLRIPAPSRLDPQFAGMEAASYALGGHFLARLNKNLREEKGWTYGVGAWYAAGEKRGSFNVSVDIPGEHFAAAVTEIEKEIGEVAANGVTDEEIDAWWRAEVMEFNQIRGTIDDAEGFYDTLADQEESVADVRKRIDAADAMTIERAREVAAAVLGEDAPRVWVVVGPKDAIDKGLAELSWEAEWVTPRDAILGRLKGGP